MMQMIKDVLYDSLHHENTLDIYLPQNKTFSVFIYFHGGGLDSGDKNEAKTFAEYLAQNGIAVVSSNYRLYPNAVYPDFIDDAAKTVAWTYKNISKYGKCNKIFIGGSSAGGYLSMMLCFDEKYLSAYNINQSEICGFVHNAGQPTCHFRVLEEYNKDSKRIIVDEKAPLYYVGTAKKYPPMLFLIADNDIENRYEQTVLMMSTLKHFGYNMDKINMKLIHSVHCEYVEKTDENNESILGQIILDFILNN